MATVAFAFDDLQAGAVGQMLTEVRDLALVPASAAHLWALAEHVEAEVETRRRRNLRIANGMPELARPGFTGWGRSAPARV